ncbi:MAG: hypothetical protein RLZZ623_3701, partial [Actinomycetota bacterium]
MGRQQDDDGVMPRHRVMRGLTAVATVLVGLGYLLWRASATLTGVPVGLAVAALSVEIAGAAATFALLVALRRSRRSVPPPEVGASWTAVAPGDVPPTPHDARLDALGRATAGSDTSAAFAATPPHGIALTVPLPVTPDLTAPSGAMDVVVRFDTQPIGHLHATLAGVRFMYGVRSITVVASSQFTSAAAALSTTRVAVVEADRRDAAALDLAQRTGTAALVAMFDAGDVPLPGFVAGVAPYFADPSVAVVQARLVGANVDSSEHDPRGRHELRFERDVLNPRLGNRGAAVFCGSGAVIRRAVLEATALKQRARRDDVKRTLLTRRARRTVELQWTIRVRARRLRIMAPTAALVVAAATNSERAVLAERRRSTAAALGLLLSLQSPLWRVRLRLTDRIGYLAYLVRPLAGFRRVAFIAIVATSLGVGAVPLDATWWGLAALWLPWMILQSYSIDRFSEGTLRPGVRTRWSMRTMGPALAGLRGAGRGLAGVGLESGRRGGPGNALRNRVLVLGLLTMTAVTIVAAVDRWHPFLSTMATMERAGLLAVSLWLIAFLLDTMRCLIGGPLLRRASRVDVSIRVLVGGSPAELVNLSPLGAGLRFDDATSAGASRNDATHGGPTRYAVNDVVDIVMEVPAVGGTPARVEARALIRNVRVHEDATFCGLEFGAMSRASADALYGYCMVLHHVAGGDVASGGGGWDDGAADQVGSRQVGARTAVTAGAASFPRRLGVRLVGVASVVGVLVATAPPYGSSAAAPSHRSAGSIEVFVFDDANVDGILGRANPATSGSGLAGAATSEPAPVAEPGVPGLELIATCVISSDLVDRRSIAITAADQARSAVRAQTTAALTEAAKRRNEIDARKANRSDQQVSFQRTIDAALAQRVDLLQTAEIAEQRVWSASASDSSAGATTSVDTVRANEPQSVVVVEAPSVVAEDLGEGRYIFRDLPGSPCRVETRSLPTFLRPAPLGLDNGGLLQIAAGGDHLRMAVVGDSPVAPTAATSEAARVEIADTVWLDSDGNGVRNALEPGLAGVLVTLHVPGRDVVVATDAMGHYRFTNDARVESGDGVVAGIDELRVGAATTVSFPATSRLTSGSGSALRLTGTTLDGAGRSEATDPVTVNLDPLTVHHGVSASYASTFELTDVVWADADNNGIQGPGESGIDGLSVLLYAEQTGDGLADGPPLASDTTVAGGRFHFGGLPAGSYVVEVFPPVGFASSTGVIGSATGPYEPATRAIDAAALDPSLGVVDRGLQLASGSIRSGVVELVPDRPVPAVAFGVFRALSIVDTMWVDDDRDGLLTQGEAGVPGVPVVLKRGDQTVTLTITDADGDFQFGHLVEGDYTADVYLPDGLEKAKFVLHQDEGETSGSSTPASTVDPAATLAPDPALTVVADPTADPTAAPTTTLPANLPTTADPSPALPGEQRIETISVAVRAGDGPAGDTSSPIPSEPGVFGLQRSTGIGRRVWSDLDDDGIIDPNEPGLPAVPVRLVSGGQIVEQTITALDGTYRFAAPLPGIYSIDVVLPAGARTSSVSWTDQKSAGTGIDNGGGQRSVGRGITPSITMGLSEISDGLAGIIANVGVFTPAPAVTLEAFANGCTADTPTGLEGPSGDCPTRDAVPDAVPDATFSKNPVVAVGAMVSVNAVVRNTGNVPLSNARVTDPSFDAGSIDCNGDADGDGQPFLLEVGDVVTCSAAVKATLGQSTSTATFDAEAERSPGLRSALEPVTNDVSWFATATGLELDAFVTTSDPGPDADGDGVLDAAPARAPTAVDDSPVAGGADPTANHLVAQGASVWWVYRVTNHSPVTIDSTTVSIGGVGSAPVCAGVILGPGESRWCVHADRADQAGQIRHAATATAIDSNTAPGIPVGVGPTAATAHLFVPTPALSLAVLVDGVDTATTPVQRWAGRSVALTYLVSNTGDLAFSSVLLSDASIGVIDCPELAVGVGGLQPGETVRCSASAAVPALPDGQLQTIAVTAEGTPANLGGRPVIVDGAPPSTDPPASETLPTVSVETVASIDPITAHVSKRAWVDANANAEFDEGEAAIADLSVTLLDGEREVAVATTDATGAYEFVDLAPGVYTVAFGTPEGLASARVFVELGVLVAGVSVTDPVMLDGTADDPAWDLPFVPVGNLTDVVWADENINGVRDTNDAPIAEVSVILMDDRGAPMAVSVTDTNGEYRFERVPPVARAARAVVVPPSSISGAGGIATPSAVLSGSVWDDVDGDGARPVAGVAGE